MIMCNACGFQCCASDLFEGCGCEDCPNPACRRSKCDICGETIYLDEEHQCPPRCPGCGKRKLKVHKSYQGGMFVVYKCSKCGKTFGEDEIPDLNDLEEY